MQQPRLFSKVAKYRTYTLMEATTTFDILLRIGSCCTNLSEQPNHGAGKCFVLSCGCKMLRLLYHSLPLIKAMMRDSLSDISHHFEVCCFVNREEDYEGYNEEGDALVD